MANLNRGIISGVVSNEPDLRTMGGGDKATKVVRFSLQIAREYGETYDCVSCVAFGKQAEWIETRLLRQNLSHVTDKYIYYGLT